MTFYFKSEYHVGPRGGRTILSQPCRQAPQGRPVRHAVPALSLVFSLY